MWLKFIYSEKATKVFKISTLLLSYEVSVSEYINFNGISKTRKNKISVVVKNVISSDVASTL